MLELDKRIKDKSQIFNRLTSEEARLYTGQWGYFANTLADFRDLNRVCGGHLTGVTEDGAFECTHGYNETEEYEFFLPDAYVTPQSTLSERVAAVEEQLPDLIARLDMIEAAVGRLKKR